MPEIAHSYGYTPFGQFDDGLCYDDVGEADNPFRFTGQWYDKEIGQYYLRARMYDPQLMRFTSRDSERGGLFEPLTLHEYLYCSNNPLNKTDNTGNSAIQIAQGLKAMTDVYAAGLGIATVGAAAVIAGQNWGWDLMNLGAFITEISPLAFAIG